MKNQVATPKPKTPAELSCTDLLGALNAKVKNFDMEMWKEQDSSCLLCNCPMHLEFGHEWPADPRMLLCWSCMADICGELLGKIEAPNAKLKDAGKEASE